MENQLCKYSCIIMTAKNPYGIVSYQEQLLDMDKNEIEKHLKKEAIKKIF